MLPAVFFTMALAAPAFTGVAVDVILEGIDTPWDVAFVGDAAYITGRDGTLHYLHNDTLRELLRISVGGGEGGLLGVAVHPEYDSNRMVYLYHTDPFGPNTVSRYVHSAEGLLRDRVIISDIPSSVYHNGGRIRFGPDMMLYVATGDAGNAGLSRDISSLAGKILRLGPDGEVPADNPFPNSPVFAYGLRNPQGMDWTVNGTMLATDHGPSGLYGRAHDEINVIVPGGDYGWPESIGAHVEPGTVPPLLHSGSDTWAPSGLEYVSGGTIPAWEGMVVYGALRGEHVGVLSVDGSYHAKMFEGEFGRVRAPISHPNGTVYLITSNTDGRGQPSEHDDLLLKIRPDPPIPDIYADTVTILWDLHRHGIIGVEQVRSALLYLAGR